MKILDSILKKTLIDNSGVEYRVSNGAIDCAVKWLRLWW